MTTNDDRRAELHERLRANAGKRPKIERRALAIVGPGNRTSWSEVVTALTAHGYKPAAARRTVLDLAERGAIRRSAPGEPLRYSLSAWLRSER